MKVVKRRSVLGAMSRFRAPPRRGSPCHNRNRLPDKGKGGTGGEVAGHVHVGITPGVRPLPPHADPSRGAVGGVAVVVDVLRARTTMRAMHAGGGAQGGDPLRRVDEAQPHRGQFSRSGEAAFLAGERQGLPIDGFDLGNSPRSCTPGSSCRGRDADHDDHQRHLGPSWRRSRPNGSSSPRSLISPRPPSSSMPTSEGSTSFVRGPMASSVTRIACWQGAAVRHFKDMGYPHERRGQEVVSGLWSKIDEAIWFRTGDPPPESAPWPGT